MQQWNAGCIDAPAEHLTIVGLSNGKMQQWNAGCTRMHCNTGLSIGIYLLDGTQQTFFCLLLGKSRIEAGALSRFLP
jgi:hypothetical protein